MERQTAGATSNSYNTSRSNKLRSACDSCHQSKVRCAGGNPCTKCIKDDIECHFSYPARVGKPKGSKNKRTSDNSQANDQPTTEYQAQPSSSPSSTPLEEQSTIDCDGKNLWQDDVYAAPQITSRPASAGYLQQPASMDADFEMLDEDIFGGVLGSEASQISRLADFQNIANDSSNFSDSIFPATNDQQNPSPLSLNTMPPRIKSAIPTNATSRANVTPSSFIMQSDTGEDTIRVENDGDSDYEPLDILKVVSAAGARKSTTISSQSMDKSSLGVGQHFNLNPSLQDGLSPLDPQRRFGRRDSSTYGHCQCLQIQSSQLCELRQVEQRQVSIQLDTIQHFAGRGYQSLEKTLRCLVCLADHQTMHVTAMVLQTFIGWIDKIQTTSLQNSSLRPTLDIQLGAYSVNNEDSMLLEIVLISQLLSKTQALIKTFRGKIQETIDAMGSRNMSTEYLISVATCCTRSLKEMTRRLEEQNSIGT